MQSNHNIIKHNGVLIANHAKGSGQAYTGPMCLLFKPGSKTCIAAAMYHTPQGATTLAIVAVNGGPYLNLMHVCRAAGYTIAANKVKGAAGKLVTNYRIVGKAKATKGKGKAPAKQSKTRKRMAMAKKAAKVAAKPATAAPVAA